MESVYRKYEPIIQRAVASFVKKHGGDYEELRADGNYYFMLAVRDHGIENLEKNVFFYVFYGLMEDYRTKCRRLRIAGPVAGSEALSVHNGYDQKVGWLADFLDELSFDATSIVDLCFNTPYELTEITKGSIRTTMKSYLKSLGWNQGRIKSAWNEICLALQ